MTLFPKTIQYETHSGGSYVDGIWVDGITVLNTFAGSVQPISDEDVNSLPVARQKQGLMKVYADIELPITKEGGNEKGTIVIWQNKKYEVIQKLDYQNNLISHYKYIIALREEL